MTVYGTGKYQFKVVENFFKRPRGWPFVEVADVAVDSFDKFHVSPLADPLARPVVPPGVCMQPVP